MPFLVNPSRFAGGGLSAYAAAVLVDAPQAYYRLGESSGTVMTDQIAARNGTYTNITLGTAGLVTGDADTAATFNGTTTDAIVTYASWMDVTTAFSTEAIIKPTGVSGAQPIADRDNSAGRAYLWRLNGDKLEFITSGGTVGIVFCTGTTALTGGTKYHVAATFDGSNIRIYINGTLEKTQAAAGAMNGTSTSNLTVGESYAGSGVIANRFTGVIDEVAYYNTVLSGARIAAHAALV